MFSFCVSAGNSIKSGQTITIQEQASKMYLSVNGEGTELNEGVNANKDKVEHNDELFKLRLLNADGTYAANQDKFLVSGDYIDFLALETDKGLMYTTGRNYLFWNDNDWIHGSGTKGAGGEGGNELKVLIYKSDGTSGEIKCGDQVYFKESKNNKYIDIDFGQDHHPAKRGGNQNDFFIFEGDGACCESECTPGQTNCNANGNLQTCDDIGGGCLKWGTETSCPSGQSCLDGKCTCQTTSKSCTQEGQKTCNLVGDLQTCTKVGECLEWQVSEDCLNFCISTDGTIPSYCEGTEATCSSTNACTKEEEGIKKCSDTNKIKNCTNVDGCYLWIESDCASGCQPLTCSESNEPCVSTAKCIDESQIQDCKGCEEAGRECGNWVNDCGEEYFCGYCGEGEACNIYSGLCIPKSDCPEIECTKEDCGIKINVCGETKDCPNNCLEEDKTCIVDNKCHNCEEDKTETCEKLNSKCGWTDFKCEKIYCGNCDATEKCEQSGLYFRWIDTDDIVNGRATTLADILGEYKHECVDCPEAKDCSDLEKNCGEWDNGCGTKLDCGKCENNEVCNDGSCCLPKTCAEMGKECGEIYDNCGKLKNCGECVFGKECELEVTTDFKPAGGTCVVNPDACIDHPGTIPCCDGSCKESCDGIVCECNNNRVCDEGENCNNCGDCSCKTGEICSQSGECKVMTTCGNEKCDEIDGENCDNCPGDCLCGSGQKCEIKENDAVCVGTILTCGVSSTPICETGENCKNCLSDCPCGVGQNCLDSGECEGTIVTCGNEKCNWGENYDNCPSDCPSEPNPFYRVLIAPTSCSDLDTQAKCNNKLNWNDPIISTIQDHNSLLKEYDFCGNKKYTITSGDDCEGYFECGCVWKNEKCLEYLDFTPIEECTLEPSPLSSQCYTDTNIVGDCEVEEEYTLEWTANWGQSNSGNENKDMGCTDGEKKLPCPDKEIMVPFFNIVNLVVAIIAIILIYLAIKNRKKLFKKTNNNSGKKIKKKKKR